jgi:hypothetical protein
MKMDFNVPYEVWCQRQREQRLREQAERRMRRPALPQGVEDILFIVANHTKDEMTRFEIVNQYSKQIGARGRKARKEARLAAFSYISGLLQVKLLEWSRRNHVRIAPYERHAKYVEARLETLRNLPHAVLD